MKGRTEEEKDVLREIGNIGGGNALTSLSMMLGRPLDFDVPTCHIIERSEAGRMLEDPSSIYAGISMTMTGTIECMLVLLMNKQFTKLVVDSLDSDEPLVNVESLTDMQKSALCEVGNIMGNSYITALGVLLDTHIDVSVPHMAVNEGSHVLQDFLDGHATHLNNLLFINSTFRTEDKMLESYILLCPTDDSLATMLEKLGF